MPKNLHDADNILLNGVQRFFVESKLLDVKVSWKDVVLLKCHKIVLASFSSYFETLLEGTTGCAILSLDAVKDDYVEHLQNIVKFMYGHVVMIKRENCQQLLEAAKIFGVTALIKLLELQLAKSPTSDTEMVVLKSFAVGSVLLVHFQRFKDDSKFVDVKISCQNRVLFICHKLVLSAFSSYFESLLIKTEGCAILNLDAVDSLYVSQLEILLNYMYGRPIFCEQTDFELLKDAAKVFGIHSLDRINCVPKKKRSRKETRAIVASKSSKNVQVSSSAKEDESAPELCEGNVAASIVQQQVNSSLVAFEQSFEAPENCQDDLPSTSSTIILSTKLNDSLPSSTKVTLNRSVLVQKPCQICGEMLKLGTKSFLTHMQNHHSDANSNQEESPIDNFKQTSTFCYDCGQVFTNENDLKLHLSTHFKNSQSERSADLTVCGQCNLAFENEANLGDHLLSCQKLPLPNVSETSKEEFFNTLLGNDSKFSCFLCKFEAVDELTLDKHSKKCHTSRVTSNICNICGETFLNVQEKDNHFITKHKTFSFSCELCSKIFKTELGFKNHCETHKSVVYKCESCDFRTKTKTYLNLHMIKYHETTLNGRSKGKKFACSQCGLTFIFDSLLKRHYQSKHLKLKPYQCPFCEYSAGENAAIKVHIRSVHTFVKPYACNMCNYKSTNSSALAKHKRRHTGEKPYHCEKCDACFTDKRDLTVHITKEHDKVRPFACEQCEFKFYRKDFLLVHIRTVHGPVKTTSDVIKSII